MVLVSQAHLTVNAFQVLMVNDIIMFLIILSIKPQQQLGNTHIAFGMLHISLGRPSLMVGSARQMYPKWLI